MTTDEALRHALRALEENHILVAENKQHWYVMWHLKLIETIKETLAKGHVERIPLQD